MSEIVAVCLHIIEVVVLIVEALVAHVVTTLSLDDLDVWAYGDVDVSGAEAGVIH